MESFAVVEHKMNKAMNKMFKPVSSMSADDIENEFWDIQAEFDKMTEEQADSWDGQVKLHRQHVLNEQFEELTGNRIL